MMKSQKTKPAKITLSLTKESIKALRDRAAREQTTISALIRRFALGLATTLLVACVSNADPVSHQIQPERLAGVSYPPEQELSILLGAFAIIAVAALVIFKHSRGSKF